jgi:hypothetical protein
MVVGCANICSEIRRRQRCISIGALLDHGDGADQQTAPVERPISQPGCTWPSCVRQSAVARRFGGPVSCSSPFTQSLGHELSQLLHRMVRPILVIEGNFAQAPPPGSRFPTDGVRNSASNSPEHLCVSLTCAFTAPTEIVDKLLGYGKPQISSRAAFLPALHRRQEARR